MIILGIESSCDETAAAVVADGRRVLASVVASQIPLHARYGGVVPEVASRQHQLAITGVISQALCEADLDFRAIDVLAVTNGPGLAGSLLVGVNAAKGIALATGLPLQPVNHLQAHIYANWLYSGAESVPPEPPQFPLLCLVVSGGHTDLVLMRGHDDLKRVGRTLDDAAGEAFDKVARLLGLGYPGGPAIQVAARSADLMTFSFPRAKLPGTFNFSFSGLKTAVLHKVSELSGENANLIKREKGTEKDHCGDKAELPVAALAAAFQRSVVDALYEKTLAAARHFGVRSLALAGGVAANSELRSRFQKVNEWPVFIPSPVYCTDNAAIVASRAYYSYGKRQPLPWDWVDLDIDPSLEVGTAG